MIKVYKAPDKIKVPELLGENWQEKEAAYIAEVKEWAKKHYGKPESGEVVNFPVADGSASYVVCTYGILIHLEIGDAYQFRYIRSLSPSDIKKEIAQAKSWAKIWAKK